MAPLSFPYGNRFRVRRFHAAPSPLRKPKNKIAAQIATFLRLGIVAWPPIADRSAKAQEISRKNEPFPFFGDRKESLIEKKLQRSQFFCFCNKRIYRNGLLFRNELIFATGRPEKTHALVTMLCKFFKVRGMQFTAIALVSSAAFDGLNVWLDLRCRTKTRCSYRCSC
ncbi:unknown [Eggerthella sp. CAG:209]|nr:unknown [Eggerthella sp. CAG:209]